MVELQTIESIKQSVKITDYLYSKGYAPINSTGKQFVYRSPLTNERTGSFYVEPERNVFNDFSSGEKGDNIRLVRLLEKVDFVAAIRQLQRFDPLTVPPLHYDFVDDIVNPEQTLCYEIIDIRPLQHLSLVKYVEGRAIPYAYALRYIREVHYLSKGKQYFGVGFQTDKGSWAIRSEKFKTWIGSAGITTLEVPGATGINLFEGFFDFLSALVYFRCKAMRNTAIILNSNANLNQALPALKAATAVYTFLDTDGKGNNGGLQAMARLRKEGVNVFDRSVLYAGYKDFNDRLRAL